MNGVEGPVVRQEGEGVDDGGQRLHGGRALGGRGCLNHQRLSGEDELPQGVEVIQQGEQDRGQLRVGGEGGGDGRARAGDRLLVLGVISCRRKVQLDQRAKHWQGQVIPWSRGRPSVNVVTGDLYRELSSIKIFSNISNIIFVCFQSVELGTHLATILARFVNNVTRGKYVNSITDFW